jgi:perosamine synthetase
MEKNASADNPIPWSSHRQEHPLRIRRTIPPSAAPISFRDLLSGLYGMIDNKVMGKIENEMKEYFGVKHVFLVSSGKAALALILKGLQGMSKKRKVIIPAYTCYSVPSAVAITGLDIVLCDLMPETLDYDYDELEKLADEDTLCIIATHLFGIPSDVCRIREIGRRRGIFIIEDAAQAMGAVQGREKLGTFGDAAFFSLGRGKNITCGSGGIIVTSSEEIGRNIKEHYLKLTEEPPGEYVKNIIEVVFMKIFLNPYFYWFPAGLPFLNIGETRFYNTFPIYRLSSFKAGLLHRWRTKLEESNNIRSKIGQYYINKLLLDKRVPMHSGNVYYLRFPLYVNHGILKDNICNQYKYLGVSQMYPDSINNIMEIREKFGNMPFKHAEAIAKTLFTLPTHKLMKNHDKVRICEAIKNGLSSIQLSVST